MHTSVPDVIVVNAKGKGKPCTGAHVPTYL